jgi:CheY-like chemotaxis protein
MILIVEDDDEVREMIRAILDAEGYRTQGATNGREALQLLGRSRELPDLILCDLRMPISGGEELLESLLPHEHLRTIPFVFMTGEAELLRDPPVSSRMPAVLAKPLDTDILLGIVREHCQRQGAEPKKYSGVWGRLMGAGWSSRPGPLVSRGPRR